MMTKRSNYNTLADLLINGYRSKKTPERDAYSLLKNNYLQLLFENVKTKEVEKRITKQRMCEFRIQYLKLIIY
jgi:hypothetical protein